MNDYQGSVAQQDIEIATEVRLSNVVGEQFYRVIYLAKGVEKIVFCVKDTYQDIVASLNVADEVKERMLANLTALYQYAPSDCRCHFMTAEQYKKGGKYKGYFVYIDSEYTTEEATTYVTVVAGSPFDNTNTYYRLNAGGEMAPCDTSEFDLTRFVAVSEGTAFDSSETYYIQNSAGSYEEATGIAQFEANVIYYTQEQYRGFPADVVYYTAEQGTAVVPTADMDELLTAMKTNLDKEFSRVLIDIPVPYNIAAEDDKITTLLSKLNKYGIDPWTFARGSGANYAWSDAVVELGPSPALYQLGRTLSVINSTGVSVGNSVDMVACDNYDVLVTRSTDVDTMVTLDYTVVSWLENMRVQYFKPLGNSTGQLCSKSGWTINGVAVAAYWILRYLNYMLRVRYAEIVTVMNTFRNSQLYDKLISQISAYISPFETLGRLSGLTITAPTFSKLPKSNGSTIIIPDAWEATFNDNVRKVKVQGTLYVPAS